MLWPNTPKVQIRVKQKFRESSGVFVETLLAVFIGLFLN